MRISSTEQFRQGIDSILDQQAKLNRTQQQLATGKKILSPSDDPSAATQIIKLSALIANNEQFDRNVGTARNELEQQENVLASSGTVLQRVRELAIQANNATQSNQSRETIGDELQNLVDELLQLSNTKNPQSNWSSVQFVQQSCGCQRSTRILVCSHLYSRLTVVPPWTNDHTWYLW